MLSFDKKILMLLGFLLPESKIWVLAKLRELAQFDDIYTNIDTCKIMLDAGNGNVDACLPMIISLLTPELKVWMAGTLCELAQIRNTTDIIDACEVSLTGAAQTQVDCQLH